MRGSWSRVYVIMVNNCDDDEWIKYYTSNIIMVNHCDERIKWDNGQEWSPRKIWWMFANKKRKDYPQLLKALTIWEISKSWPVIAKGEWKLTKNGQCWQYDQEMLKIATSPCECCQQHHNDNCDEENFLVRCQIVCKCLSAWYNGTTTAKDLNCRPGTNTETEIPISRGTRAHLLFCLL